MTRIKEIIGALGLAGQERGYVVGGSGVLELRGIRLARDVDIYVNDRTFRDLYITQTLFEPPDDTRTLTLEVRGVTVNVMRDWKWDGYPVELRVALNDPDYVDGVPCIPLTFLLAWKRIAGTRPKDSVDVALIEDYLVKGGV